MAGSISLSLSQQFDELGEPLNGGALYFYAAGTTTPQSAYQDVALTLPYPNPIVLDSAGRIPAFYLADGQIKIRLTNAAGVTQVAADNLLVVGASSGSGSPPSVDATTILATGDIKIRYGTGVLSGFVRSNGRTVGSASSGATERANADCQNLFEYLWGTDANLAVSGGRGASAAADFAANKTIALPDFRGRVPAGLDDMGNTSAARLTLLSNTTLGASGGAQSVTLTLAQLPTGITSSNTGAIALNVTTSAVVANGSPTAAVQTGATVGIYNTSTVSSTGTIPIGDADVTSNNTNGSDHANLQPMMLITIYLKL